ncbi:MAG: serine palmitoyltransferase component [Bathelium mastoideum]|nr:MAG: serine palmitoyltransferase component [Bathelium mastoideum]
MDLHEATSAVVRVANDMSDHFQKMPGSAILMRYIKSSYQHDPVRSAIELFLFLFAIRYLLAPKYSTQKRTNVLLTEEEIDDLVDEWTPEPLVAEQTSFEEAENEKRPIISGPTGPKSKLLNGRVVTNLASYNFYNFVANEEIKEQAVQTLRTYGVGPCGPPNFYGTQDVHMKVQADIASHLGVPACVLYAQAMATIMAVIPAFSKRGDIIVADKAVNFAIRKGLYISRSTVRWYEHNDVQDLERVLRKITEEQANKPLTRKFILTEGIFENTGDIPDLPKIVELKTRHKFRLILDETHSYGILGRTGRGLTEHAHVDPGSIDMIVGSLAHALCAGGGFCAGSTEVVEHQRLSAAAHTFSAALPALLATTASATLRALQEAPEGLLKALREQVKVLRAQLEGGRSEWVGVVSAVENPVLVLVLRREVVAARGWGVGEEERVLQEVVDEALANGVLITRMKSHPLPIGTGPRDQVWQPQPALKVCATIGLSKKEIEKAGTVVRHAITKVMSRKR